MTQNTNVLCVVSQGNVETMDEEMLQQQDVKVEVRSDDEFARRPHRALDFENEDTPQSVQDKIS